MDAFNALEESVVGLVNTANNGDRDETKEALDSVLAPLATVQLRIQRHALLILNTYAPIINIAA